MAWNRLYVKGENGTQVPIRVALEADIALIHAGIGFTHSDLHTSLAAAATHTHVIKTNNYPMHLRHLRFEADGGPLLAEYFYNATLSDDGTLKPVGNNYLGHTFTNETEIYEDPTITDDGTQMGSTIIPASSNQGGGVGILAGGEWVLPANTTNLIKLTNNDAQPVDYTLTLFWTEPHHLR